MINKSSEICKCWCGSKLTESIHEMYGTCVKCGTQVLKKRLSLVDLENFYKDSYWTTFMENSYNNPTIYDRSINDFYDRIPFYYQTLTNYIKNPESLLEIGCSHGGFLYYCLKNSIKSVTGIEIDATTCSFAKERFGLENIVEGMFPEVSLPKDKYDAIVCFDVLEHFLEPIKTMKAVSEKLSDAGICFFVTPAYRGEDKNWDRYRVDEHLYLFNEVSAFALAQEANIEIIDIYPSLYNQDMIIIGKKRQKIENSSKLSTLAIPYHEYGINLTPNISLVNNDTQKHNPLISTIFIVGKDDELTQKSFTSLLSQFYANFEIIIIADNSYTNLSKLTGEIPDKIAYSTHQYDDNMNIPARINECVETVHGDYITFLTEQGALYSNHLFVLMNAIEKSKNDAVFSNTYRAGQINTNGKYSTIKREYIFENTVDLDLLLKRPAAPIFSSIISKKIFLENSKFSEQFNLCYDWEFWIRYSKSNQIYKTTRVTSEYFFRGDNSIVTEDMRTEFLREKDSILKKHNHPNNDLNHHQLTRLAIDRFPVHPFPKINIFMDNIIKYIENTQLPEAKEYYTKYRKFIPPIPELLKLDALLKTIK